MITCKNCGHQEPHYLGDHLQQAHGMTASEYLELYPDAPTMSARLMDEFKKRFTAPRRQHPPALTDLTIHFGDMKNLRFQVNAGVPPEVCLPLPPHYRLPRTGDLSTDVKHALISLKFGRSMYIWGLPGSGKDALFHAWSARTRTPAIIRQTKPGTDIQAWFFSRSFNQEGTFWEEGEILKALRDGYLLPDGTRVPYMLLITDFDRADRAQAEHVRLITDSIQGRVDGPQGTFHVLAGTRIVATANTSGAGDSRGRMISANPIDASIMDRFERAYMFRWMEWVDEEPIVRAKFPTLTSRVPKIFTKMGKVTKALRDAIMEEKLHGEFSHRGVCAILGHAQDILEVVGDNVPDDLMQMAARPWLDKLPDAETRQDAQNIMDPHLKGGLIAEGDKKHIKEGSLVEGL